MEMINLILGYGLTNATFLSAVILISLYINPKIWLQDLPKEVQNTIPEKSKFEKKQTIVTLIVFLIFFITLPVIAVINIQTQPSLIQSFIIAYCIYFIFNLTDLLIIDWLIICTFTPNFIKIKGVDEQVYKNYWKHLKDFFKGVVIIIIPSICSGLIGYFYNKI